MKIANLYCGLGGNRHSWGNEHEITAVDLDKNILAAYAGKYPGDRSMCVDASRHLLFLFRQYDFIWSSPPCQSHSRMLKSGRNRKPRYVEMELWQHILFLQNYATGYWCVENVVPYYGPFIEPSIQIGRHLFWTNFDVGIDPPQIESPKNLFNRQNLKAKGEIEDWLGIGPTPTLYYDGNHDPTQVLRNCVHPEIGRWILDQVPTDR